MAETKSRFSFDGFKWKELILGNWTTFKEIGKVFVSSAAMVEFMSALSQSDPVLFMGLTLIGKAILDALEFWVKEETTPISE
jgi:hypothetical protein